MRPNEEIRGGFHLDMKDERVDLVLHAAAKALSEIYAGSYECKDLEDGWSGIRVFIDEGQVEKIGPGRRRAAIKKLIVDFEKQEFSFER